MVEMVMVEGVEVVMVEVVMAVDKISVDSEVRGARVKNSERECPGQYSSSPNQSRLPS